MAAVGTQERKSAAELRADKKAREGREAEQSNGRADIDAEHAKQGTPPATVPGVPGSVQSDPEPQDIHGSDEDEIPTGSVQQLSFQVGGKKPTSTQLRLVGGKVEIGDVFVKGQTIELRVTCTVGAIEFVDEHDKVTGQTIGCQRRHKAKIDSVSVV